MTPLEHRVMSRAFRRWDRSTALYTGERYDAAECARLRVVWFQLIADRIRTLPMS